jgi:hypothetical protein
VIVIVPTGGTFPSLLRPCCVAGPEACLRIRWNAACGSLAVAGGCDVQAVQPRIQITP